MKKKKGGKRKTRERENERKRKKEKKGEKFCEVKNEKEKTKAYHNPNRAYEKPELKRVKK